MARGDERRGGDGKGMEEKGKNRESGGGQDVLQLAVTGTKIVEAERGRQKVMRPSGGKV